MTEEEEIMRFGTVMYRIDENGKRHHIPREEWDRFYKPEDDKNAKTRMEK